MLEGIVVPAAIGLLVALWMAAFHRGQHLLRIKRTADGQERIHAAVARAERDPFHATLLFAQAVALNPSQVNHLHLASALHSQGHMSLAEQEYDRAGNIPSGMLVNLAVTGISRLELARIESDRREWKQAINYCMVALDCIPEKYVDERADAFLLRAYAKWQLGQDEDAKRDVDAAIGSAASERLQGMAQIIRSWIAMTSAADQGFDVFWQHMSLRERILRAQN